MNSRLKMMAAVASLAVVIIALRCLWLWQPERQLLLHQAHFRTAVEDRNWKRIGEMIDPGYGDRWGYTHDSGIAAAQPWLGQFFALTITTPDSSDALTADGGTVTEQWRMAGTGAEGASMVMDRVNQMKAPFVFTWKHVSWKPWDWRLVRIDNAEVNLSDAGFQ